LRYSIKILLIAIAARQMRFILSSYGTANAAKKQGAAGLRVWAALA
jgi:hypothetical protein